jgi:hypothetical protein
MSGYLQRLVSSATRPTSGVHPVIAPLFSTQYGSAGEDLAEAAAPAIAPRMSTPSEAGREPSGTIARVDAISPHPLPVATAVTRRPAEELSPRNTVQSVAHAPGEQGPEHPLPSRESPASFTEVDGVQSIFTPLLPERVSTVSLAAVDSHPASPSTATSRREAADRIRSSASHKREPDEIQITIGRIEVTAVPEAPARPAAKPGRKQISLDEYLKRADGRGR